MKLKPTIIFIALCSFVNTIIYGQKVTYDFISKFRPLATTLKNEWGIPVSIILGVSILESGSGTSINCRQLNNYFGITGKNQLKNRRSMYKQYLSAEESFKDFCRMISRKKFYPGLKRNMNYRSWLKSMNHSNYATAKNIWITRITNIIVKYNLVKYDNLI